MKRLWGALNVGTDFLEGIGVSFPNWGFRHLKDVGDGEWFCKTVWGIWEVW